MSDTERSPAEILEEHGRESIQRIEKIDAWVRRVSKLLLGLIAVTMLTGLTVAAATYYLLGQIQDSRYDTAVKGCQISRSATQDGLSQLMVSLSKGPDEEAKARTLAKTYFPADKDTCVGYAEAIGLAP